jgi:hypothetical protein
VKERKTEKEIKEIHKRRKGEARSLIITALKI